MGRERTVQAALRLNHDASLIMTNVPIMSQLVTSFSRTASEVMRTVHERAPFPTRAVDFVKPGRRVRRAAHYMAAMGLWRPTSDPVFPGPVPASSCNSCMVCEDCFPDNGRVPTEQGKQGKQGKWLIQIPCRENSGNLKILQNSGKTQGISI